MKIRIGFEFVYEFVARTPMVLMLNVHPSRAGDLIRPDHLRFTPALPVTRYADMFGNVCSRVVAPAGRIEICADAVVADSGRPDAVDFTYVLVDCPPSLNLLTVNALAAANAILVPLQCEFFALEGLSQLLKTVEQVKSTLNPGLTIHGIVLTMHDARNNLSNQVVADVRANSKEKVYATIIPRNVRVSEAPSYGKPVLVYDLKCVGSEAYLRLATEIIQREKELLAGSAHPDGEPGPDQQSGAA